MRDTSNLTPRMHVHIRAFDDTSSWFRRSSRAASQALPSQDRLPESTASLTSSWSYGSSHQTATEALRELLKP